MSILNYAKEHPWATGTIVVIGGIIFIMIVRGGSSSSSGSGPSRPSDAEIAANATISAAQIAAQAQAAQAGAAVNAAQIGAGVQLNSDNKAAEIAMAQINAQKDLAAKMLEGETNAKLAAIQNIGTFKGKGGYDEQKAAALQTIFSGQNAPIPIKGSNPGNSAGAILGGVGNILGNFGGIASLFSDQRLKENIVHIGYDKKGRDVFEYNYKGSKTRRRGFIAQQIARAEPQLVHTDEPTGFFKVSAYG